MLRKPESRATRRVLIALPITAVAFAATNLGSMAFATIVPTTTTATAPATAAQGQSVTLGATVTPTGLLSGVGTVQGTVTWKVGTTTVASHAISGCSAGKACSTSATTTTLPVGDDAIVATYAPSGGATAGSSSTAVHTQVYPTTQDPTKATCTEGTACDAGTVYANDLSSSIDVSTTGGTAGTYTITEGTGGSTLSCQDITSAQPGNYEVSTNDVTVTITYKAYGSAADAFDAAHGQTPAICFGAPGPFTTASGTTATFVNGEYEGILPACNATQSNTPCGLSQTHTVGDGPSGSNSETLVVIVNAGTTAGGNGNGNTCTHHNGQPQNCNAADPKVGP